MANLSNINGKFVIEQATGYVGIGITDPSQLLHLQSTADTILKIDNITSGTGKSYLLQSTTAGSFVIRDEDASSNRLLINTSGNATFAGTISSGAITASGSTAAGVLTLKSTAASDLTITTTAANTWEFSNAGNNSVYNGYSHTFKNGATTGLTINNSGNATFAGNISVTGTSFLDGDVTIGDTNSAFIGMARAGANYIAATNASGELIFRTAGSTPALTLDTNQNATFAAPVWIPDYIYHVGDANTKFGFSGNDTFVINTSGTTALTIDASRNATFTATVTAPTFSGDLNGTINTVTTATTKGNSTNDTTVATTAFVQNVIGTIPAGLVFQGTWNASTNSPTLTSGSGTTGNFYIVSTAGTTNLDGITDWQVGDWAVFIEQGASDQWEKIDNSSVLSGSGTGGSFAGWSGSGTSVTLGNAPVTFSGNNSTFAGDVYVTGTSNSNVVISRDNMFVDAGQLYIGADDGSTDDSFRQQVSNGSFFINTRKSGTWTNRLQINSAGTLIAGQGATFAGKIVAGGGVQFTGGTIAAATAVLHTNNFLYLRGGTEGLIISGADGSCNFRTTNSEVLWEIGGAEKMRINSSGDVLMGNTVVNPASGFSNQRGLGYDSSTGQTQIASTDDVSTLVLGRNNATDGSLLEFRKQSTVIGNFGSNTTGGQVLLDLKANQNFRIVTNNVERMRIDSSGNVNIGTISATSSSKVTIQAQGANGSDETALVLRNYSAAPYTGYVTQEFEVGTVNMAEISGRRIDINNGEIIFRNKKAGTISASMVIDTSGNVGIGTGTPGAKLEVRHATYANTNETATFINGNQPVRVAYDTMVVAQTDVPCLSITETVGDSTQATEQKLTFAVGDNSAVIGSSSTVANGIYINTNRPTNVAGYLTGQGTNVARFLNNGYAIFPVRVGIGTTSSPSYSLDVKGPDTNDAVIARFYSNTGARGSFIIRNGSGTNPTTFIGTAGGSEQLSIGTNNTEALRIDASQNVGIGTTAIPTNGYTASGGGWKMLQIGQSSQIAAYGTDDEIGIFQNTYLNTSGVFQAITSNVMGSSIILVDGKIYFKNATTSGTAQTTSTRMLIDTSGNVGIGDTSPTSISANTNSLSVNSSRSDLSGALISKANGTVKHQQYWDSSGYNFVLNSGNFKFQGGNVGIGTTSPTNILHTSTSSNAVARFESTDGVAYIRINDTSDSFYVSTESQIGSIGGIAGANNGNLNIDLTNGNVGIGTTSPSGPFHVKVGTSTPLVVASSSYCNNVGIRTTTPTASLQVKGNVSYSYNNYTNVANTWINVINFSGYPAGLYQISIIKKTNASTYITAIVKWSATAGTVINTIASNQLSITFSGTQLQAISGLATGTLMSANLQCLVTNEDFCS